MSKRKWQVYILGNGNVLSPSSFCQNQHSKNNSMCTLHITFANTTCWWTCKQTKACWKGVWNARWWVLSKKLVMRMMEYGTKEGRESHKHEAREMMMMMMKKRTWVACGRLGFVVVNGLHFLPNYHYLLVLERFCGQERASGSWARGAFFV